MLTQDIRFCTAPDGARIAYALSGHGPPLVFPATWQAHLEMDVTLLGFRHWLEGLSKHHTLIRGDLRGSGLSDWDPPSMDFEDWVADLEAMVDDAGLDRFPIFGLSHATATAIAYTVRHPERVSHLVLYAARADPYVDELSEKGLARLEAYYGFMRAFWTWRDPRYQMFFTSDVVPAASPEIVAALDEVRRKSMSPENAVRAFDTMLRISVSDLLPQISVPTLVLQPGRGSSVTLATAREVAARIPNAHLVVLDVDNHLIQEYEPGWPVLLEETWRFLGIDTSAGSTNGHQETHNGAVLSAREREVLALLARNQSNAEIASALTISPATASSHVHNILGKLGVNRRGQAATWWAEHHNGSQ